MTEILLASGNLRAKSVNSAVLRTAAALAEGGMRTSEGLDTLPLQPDDDPSGGLVPPPVAELRRLGTRTPATVAKA